MLRKRISCAPCSHLLKVLFFVVFREALVCLAFISLKDSFLVAIRCYPESVLLKNVVFLKFLGRLSIQKSREEDR